MKTVLSVLPFISSLVSLVFAGFVLRRYAQRRGPHLLLWGIGMIFYAIGGFCEGYYGAFGWSPIVFRLWYLFGALLVAAWLGQGTVYLLARRAWAHALMVLLGLGSLYGAFRVFGAQLDPALLTTSLHTGSELSGSAIVSAGVRTLTPIFNFYGTLALVGGALYSAFVFWRKRVLLHRVIGNVLIAAGALLPAFGGTFSRLGIPGALYISELLGAILLFVGFLRAVTPMKAAAPANAKPAAQKA
jgi:vacuolar-type H+-ATPase subunit I/STV1